MIDLHGIISIAGMPGLFKVVAQSKNGVIVEALADKRRFPAFASHKISSLEDIGMFTDGDDKPISEIMKLIYDKENGGVCIDHKKMKKKLLNIFLLLCQIMIKIVFIHLICVNFLVGITNCKQHQILK